MIVPQMITSFRRLSRLALLLLGAVVQLQPLSASESDRFETAREMFRRAYAQAGTASDVHPADPRELRNYPLYPYLQRARIEYALKRADEWAAADEQVKTFLEAHEAEPVGRGLRRVWLQSLVRRELWQALVEQYRPDAGDEALRCWSIRARIRLAGDEEQVRKQAEAEAVELWLTPRRLPPVCEPVFEWLRGRGTMTADLTEQRVRRLLRNGQYAFARIIARRLPAERAAPLELWADLIEKPARTIDRILEKAPRLRVETEVLLDGWTRLARADPDAALERYPGLVSRLRLDAGQESRFALALALALAWSRRPEALEFFDRVAANDLDDYALAWKARAALWAGDWRRVEESIAAMSEKQRAESRWKYWLARAAEQRGDSESAASIYASILPDDNFYSAKAAARLDRLAEPHPSRLEIDREAARRVASRAFFVRARELALCEMHAEAVSEWLVGYTALDDGARPQAIHLAAEWGLYDAAIAAAARSNIFNDYELLYPQPYDEQVKSAAALTGLDIPLLYGIIRQESLFRRDAVSPAGAIGLVQLRRDTARIVAKRLKQPAPRTEDLFDPAINLRLGAAYLRSLLDRFGGQLAVALAGYNAGPTRVMRWLPKEPIDVDIWIENIPYNETREYVQRVMWHSLVFAWLRAGKAQDVSAWLRVVTPLRLEASERSSAPGKSVTHAGSAAGSWVPVAGSAQPSAK